jgi:hypothetical protein
MPARAAASSCFEEDHTSGRLFRVAIHELSTVSKDRMQQAALPRWLSCWTLQATSTLREPLRPHWLLASLRTTAPLTVACRMSNGRHRYSMRNATATTAASSAACHSRCGELQCRTSVPCLWLSLRTAEDVDLAPTVPTNCFVLLPSEMPLTPISSMSEGHCRAGASHACAKPTVCLVPLMRPVRPGSTDLKEVACPCRRFSPPISHGHGFKKIQLNEQSLLVWVQRAD